MKKGLDKVQARQILQLVNRSTTLLLRSVRRVNADAPEQAALFYRRRALKILNPLSDIVFDVWTRFPELEPKRKAGVTYYDPDRWNIPKVEVKRAHRTLGRVQATLEALSALLAASAKCDDKPLKEAARAAHGLAESAARSVLEQHPDSRRHVKQRAKRAARAGHGASSRHSRRQSTNPDVAEVFGAYPKRVRARLLELRRLVLSVASETEGVGELAETLKWGQPAYLSTKPRTGTTIRLGQTLADDTNVAMFVHCQTSLIDTARATYGDTFQYHGGRAIVFHTDEDLPVAQLKHFIATALTYHLRRRGAAS